MYCIPLQSVIDSASSLAFSLCTSLCLQWEPQAIAIAFIYLAGKLSKFDLVTATQSKSRSWWRQYLDTLDVHDLESICHQVLDIYGEEEVGHVLLYSCLCMYIISIYLYIHVPL